MFTRLIASALGTTCLLLLATTPCFGQGTAADYQRAAQFPQWAGSKVFLKTVRPNWDESDRRFWYRVQTGRESFEFVLVDAHTATRKPAFHHEKLAEALKQHFGKPFNPRNLPLKQLEFSNDASLMQFRCDGQKLTWDSKQRDLKVSARSSPEATNENDLTPLADLENSIGGSGEIQQTFENRTEQVLKVFWRNSSGQELMYFELKPGESREQHTFIGHVWVFRDQESKPIAAYRAEKEHLAARVTNKTQPPRQKRRDSPNPRRDSGISPDGKWRAFIQNHNVQLEQIDSKNIWPLSTTGNDEDAFQSRFYWSPDSTHFVVMQRTRGQNRQISFIESAPKDQLQPKLHTFTYAKPGDEIAQSRPRLFNVERKRQIPLDDSLFSNPWSITQLRWSPDSRRFTFLYNQRGHQVMRLLAIDIESSSVIPIINEEVETFIDYTNKVATHYLDETNEIIWMSERSGWNHLYLIDAQTGAVKNAITKGEWVVREIEQVDVEQRRIWFQAGGLFPDQDPYYVHLCRVDFDGSNLVTLTEGDGQHRWQFSPNREYFIDRWSRVDQPPIQELRETASGKLICRLETADDGELRANGWHRPERFVAKGRDGKTDIHGIIVRPMNFDPTKRYPIIEKIYAGPHSSFVPKSYRLLNELQKMAELGFIVVQIDGMGTSHRSKAFHDVCWRNLGDAGFPDRKLWITAAAEKYLYMDLTRVGIYGGSAGGQSTVRALTAHPEFYHVGVADCGCHDNRMDKIWWNEQWMGWPIGPHYAQQSNVTNAHQLQGKLLLVVGELDRNVDPASTMQVVDALIKADKDFDLLVMPGYGHGAAESPYGKRRRMDFFVRHLLKVEPRG